MSRTLDPLLHATSARSVDDAARRAGSPPLSARRMLTRPPASGAVRLRPRDTPAGVSRNENAAALVYITLRATPGDSPGPAGRAVTPGIRGSPDEAALLPDDDAITGTILGTGTERRSSSDTPEYFSALGVRSRAEDEGTQWPIVEL
jgi:hypothetical protein